MILGLCRELGLRVREAALLDCQSALHQSASGHISIERGTKGGRSKSTISSPSYVERLVPATSNVIDVLTIAAELQGKNDNLVPEGKNLSNFIALIRKHSKPALNMCGIKNRHELRAAYACERYEHLTGCVAPVIAGHRQASKEDDLKAREIIARELGHNRPDVLAAYIGSSKSGLGKRGKSVQGLETTGILS